LKKCSNRVISHTVRFSLASAKIDADPDPAYH
jgi:hypothetical protein